MNLRCVAPDLDQLSGVSAELIACGIWEDAWPMRGLAGLLDWRLAGRLSTIARRGDLRGTFGEVMFVPGRPRLSFDKVIVIGLGLRANFDDKIFRDALHRLENILHGLHVQRAVIELPGRADNAIEPERAAELILEDANEKRDAWWLVETSDAEKRILAHTEDDRRRSRRP
jgi:hypothetical protein